EFCVGQIFDLLGVFNACTFAKFASARTANTVNGGESDFSVLMRRDVNASNTSHDCSLCVVALGLALTLLVTRVGADDSHHAVTFDDLAIAANLLYRCHYLHDVTPDFL